MGYDLTNEFVRLGLQALKEKVMPFTFENQQIPTHRHLVLTSPDNTARSLLRALRTYLYATSKPTLYLDADRLPEGEDLLRHLHGWTTNEFEYVLIEQIDRGMHPARHYGFLRRCREAMPGAIFIVSTLSPFLLQEVDREDILVSVDGMLRHPRAQTLGASVEECMVACMDTQPRPQVPILSVCDKYAESGDPTLRAALVNHGLDPQRIATLDESVPWVRRRPSY